MPHFYGISKQYFQYFIIPMLSPILLFLKFLYRHEQRKSTTTTQKIDQLLDVIEKVFDKGFIRSGLVIVFLYFLPVNFMYFSILVIVTLGFHSFFFFLSIILILSISFFIASVLTYMFGSVGFDIEQFFFQSE